MFKPISFPFFLCLHCSQLIRYYYFTNSPKPSVHQSALHPCLHKSSYPPRFQLLPSPSLYVGRYTGPYQHHHKTSPIASTNQTNQQYPRYLPTRAISFPKITNNTTQHNTMTRTRKHQKNHQPTNTKLKKPTTGRAKIEI